MKFGKHVFRVGGKQTELLQNLSSMGVYEILTNTMQWGLGILNIWYTPASAAQGKMFSFT